MPARSKQIIKHRRKDKGMESKIEIIEIKEIIEKEEKTKAWGPPQEEENDRTVSTLLEILGLVCLVVVGF